MLYDTCGVWVKKLIFSIWYYSLHLLIAVLHIVLYIVLHTVWLVTMSAAIKPAIDAVFSSVKDLIKYAALARVNSGDKQQDQLINTAVISVITVLFTWFSYDGIATLITWIKNTAVAAYERCVKKEPAEHRNTTTNTQSLVPIKLTEREAWDKFRDHFKMNTAYYYYYSWYVSDESRGLTNIILGYLEPIVKRCPGHINYIRRSKNTIRFESDRLTFDKLARSFVGLFSQPIYNKQWDDSDAEHEFVGLYRNGEGVITFTANNQLFLNKFLQDIICRGTIQEEKECYTSKDTTRKIMDYKGNESAVIYPDRTFSMYVSQHLPQILLRLQRFIDINNGSKTLGGYANHNLGILLHGEPGTGKTLFMKCLANELGRNIVRVDLTSIKTKKDFENMFTAVDYKTVIYCFDEFDCVQDVICDREAGQQSATAARKRQLQEIYDNIIEKIAENEGDDQPIIESSTTNVSTANVSTANVGTANTAIEEHKKAADVTDTKKSEVEKDKIDVDTTIETTVFDHRFNHTKWQIEQNKRYVEGLRKAAARVKEQIAAIDQELSLDSVLTVLDGTREYRGRVIVACTNYLDKIDRALKRAGRFDIHLHLTKFVASEVRQLLHKIYEESLDEKNTALINEHHFEDHVFTPVDIICAANGAEDLSQCLDILDQETARLKTEATQKPKRGRPQRKN